MSDGKWYPCNNCGKVVYAFEPKHHKRKGWLMLAWHRHSDGWRDHTCEQANSMVQAEYCFDTKEEASKHLMKRHCVTEHYKRNYCL